MLENRLVNRLATYWETLKKDKALPDHAQLNPSAISDIWQQCVLFAVQPTQEMAPPVLSFQNIGDKLHAIYDKSMLGRTVSASQSQFPGAKIIRRVNEVIDNPAVLFDEGQFVSASHKTVKYRSCLLPFAGKEGRVSHIVVGLSWREF